MNPDTAKIIDRLVTSRDGLQKLDIADYAMIREAREAMADAANALTNYAKTFLVIQETDQAAAPHLYPASGEVGGEKRVQEAAAALKADADALLLKADPEMAARVALGAALLETLLSALSEATERAGRMERERDEPAAPHMLPAPEVVSEAEKHLAHIAQLLTPPDEDAIRILLSSLSSERERAERLADERERLILLICGGEDAPGYAASLTFDQVETAHDDHIALIRARAQAAEAKVKELEAPFDWTAEDLVDLMAEAIMKPEDETITFGGRTYRKFIRYPGPVTDGTVRCFACGQIDEDGAHDPTLCPECDQYTGRNPGGDHGA